jgi:YcxB-like protein
MTLIFNWIESDYVSAYWAWLLRRPWTIALGWWYSLLIFAIVIWRAITTPQDWQRLLLFVLAGLGAAILGFIRTRWNMHRAFKALLLDGLVTAIVDERGISLEANQTEKIVLWADVSRFYESSRVFVLEKGKNEYIFLPKRVMSDSQSDQVRQYGSMTANSQRAVFERTEIGTDAPTGTITCLDDVPVLARMAARQRFFMRWYQALGLAPFFVVGLLSGAFNDSPVVDVVFVAALAWTFGVIVYTVYLWVSLRCPVCKNRFGIADNCRSCKLPRHSAPAGLFRASS